MIARPSTSASLSPRLNRRRILRAISLSALLAVVALAALFRLSPTVRLGGIRVALWLEARIQPAHLTGLQRTLEPWLPARTVILAGDSLIGMLPSRLVDARAVNFGIGAATVETIRAQFHGLRTLPSARALVLLVGTNDVVHRPLAAAEADLRALLAALPASLPVLLCTVPPIDPAAQHDRPLATIAQFNRRWAACAAERPHTRLVNVASVLADATGRLRPTLHLGDGLHLNAEGHRLLGALLQQTLAEFVP